MKTNNTQIVYKVLFVNVVDQPEKRDSTYPKVKAGTAVAFERSSLSYQGAINLYEGMIAGEEDFAGEYIRRVEVIAIDVRRPYNSIARQVRKMVQREGRDQPWCAAS